ncbi:InlB B-repeat-containing protein [Huintestinicola sp.]
MSVKTFIAAMSLKVKIIIACSAAFVISGAVAAGVILTKEDTYRVLKVFEMTGSSVITREGTGDIDAYIGMNLESGDTVTVGSGSTLRLALDSDKYLMLDSDTVLELIASGTAADSRTAINLKQGTILNEITTPLSANSSYEVSAPKATMAVRGTSFTVSVDKDNDGGYTIRENTLNGKVEVTLLDAEGNPTKKLVLVGADKGVTIRTEPDENSGNPAEKDGISRFVMEDENGNIFELGEGDDPIHEIFYNMLSAKVKENALRSNDEHLMELDELIVRKLRGKLDESNTEEASEDTAPAETAPVTESVTEPETVPEQGSTPAEATAPAETAVPETAMEAPQSVVTNAPVSAEPQPETVPETIPETVPETVPETAPETSAETAPETSAETSASSVTTVPTETKPDSTSAKTTAKTTANSSGTSVSTVTAPSNTGTLPPYTGTMPSYTGTAPSQPAKDVYTVTFMYNGEVYSTELVEEGSKIGNIPEPPARTGYTGKWYLGDEEFTYDTPITSDITVNAVYTAKTYTVTFTANAETDNAFTKSFEAAYGETVIAPDVPAKTGYTGKWYLGDEEFTSAYIITSDITVTAKYTVNTYTVTFVVDNKVLTSVKAEYNTSIKEYVPAVPEKEGYRDGKWCLETDAEFDPAMLITEDMTVTAVYTPMEFTVTYVPSYDESVVLSTETVSYGAVPSGYTPTTVIDTDNDGSYDYYLWGWDEAKAAIAPITEDTAVTVPYVEYNLINEVRVTDRGSTLIHRLFKMGETLTLPDAPTPDEGYEFVGWGSAGSGGNFSTGLKEGDTSSYDYNYGAVEPYYAAGTSVTLGLAVNTEYKAVYKLKVFTVTIVIDGTSENEPAEYGTYLSEYLTTLPDKDGIAGVWLVNGTVIDPTAYKVTADVTVTADYPAADTLSLDTGFELPPIADISDAENEETVPETGIPETPDTSSSDTSDSTPEQPVTESQTEVIPDETGTGTESSEPAAEPQTEDTTDDTIV